MNPFIKIKKVELDVIITALQNDKPALPVNTITEKTIYYLFNNVIKKLLSKQITKSDNTNNKAFKISFKYYEAAILFNELKKISSNDIYINVVCLKICNKIHEQLI